MSKKVYLLVNQTAGTNRGASAFKKIKTELEQASLPYQSYISRYAGELTALAKHVANKVANKPEQYLVVVGGDGSLNQALNGIKHSHFPETPLAYVPAGTGDDFARALKFKQTSHDLVTHLKNSPEVRSVDCGHYFDLNRQQDGYFVNNLGIGFDAYVVAQTNNSRLKKQFNHLNLGNLTYGANIIKALANQETFGVTITTGHQMHHFNDAYLVTTTNHPYFGGGVPLLPKANPFSHKLDTVVVEKPSLPKFTYLFSKLLINGSHVTDPHFHYYEAEQIQVRTTDLEYGQLDGEELGSRSFDLKFEISNFNLLS